jgi:hypothetical protein
VKLNQGILESSHWYLNYLKYTNTWDNKLELTTTLMYQTGYSLGFNNERLDLFEDASYTISDPQFQFGYDAGLHARQINRGKI